MVRRDNGVTTVMVDNTFEWSSAGGLVKYYSHAGEMIAVRNAAGLHWLFGDRLGSSSSVRTAAGTIVRQRYQPYGRLRGAATLPTEYGYTGQRLDPTGLMDYNARQYDPVLGRFTSPDTIIPDPADPQAFNRYTYVNNNPVNFTDPTGHEPCMGGGAGCSESATAEARGWPTPGGKSTGEKAGPRMPAQVPACSICGGFSTMPAHEGGPNWGLTYSIPILGQIAALTRLVTDWGSLSGWQRAEAGAVVTVPFLAKGIQILRGGASGTAGSIVDDVIAETQAGTGNLTSRYTLTADEALTAGDRWVGAGYDELGKPGSGVFRSADETRQFRIDNGSITGTHSPGVPHVHLETILPGSKVPVVNNHIPIVG